MDLYEILLEGSIPQKEGWECCGWGYGINSLGVINRGQK